MRIGRLFARRRSVLFGWLLSYLLILAVPLVVTFLTQSRTAAILEREITDAHLIVLKRIRERMDAQVETAWRLTQEVAFNPRLEALTRGFTPPPPGGYSVYEMSRDLRSYRALYSSIEDLYVYLPRIDSILSSAGLVDARTYHETYLRERGVAFDAWHREIARVRRGDFVLFGSEAAAESGSIVYVQSAPLFAAEPDATVAISLSRGSFVQDARDIATLNGAAVVVLDSGDRMIAASAGAQGARVPRYRDLPEQEGLIRERGAKGPVIGSCIVSSLTDWKYVVVVPREVFWRKAETARRIALAGLFLCVILGGALVVVSLKRHYDPVGEIVALMERYQGRDIGRGDNEFGFIRRAIAQAEEEREKYGAVVAQQDRTLRENLLRRLLKGALPPGDTLSDRLYLHGIRFAGDTFVVAALYVVDYDEVFSSSGDDRRDRDAYEEYRKAQFIMAAAFEELLAARGHRAFGVEVDDLLAVLVSLGPGAANRAREEIDAVAETAASRLDDRIRIHFLMAVSAPHVGVDAIPQAWSEALQTMEYKRLLGIERPSHFEDVAEIHGGRIPYPPETERRLINAMRTGDAVSAVAIIREVFDRSFAPGRLAPAAARCLMFDLVSTMIKAMEETEGVTRKALAEPGGPGDPIERLMACESAQELERGLVALVEARCAGVREELARRSRGRHREGARRLSERVLEEVSRGFADPGLDISALARSFEVNPITLSRIFHEETGESLLDHINRVRIERAKDLMRELPDEPIEEIGRRVGYGSSKTFTRAFKRREGVTPGRYRASLAAAAAAGRAEPA